MNRLNQITTNLVVALSLLAMSVLAAAEDNLSVEEIVHRANYTAYYQGKDGRAQVSMVIIDSQGRSRERRFTILRLDVSDSDEVTDASYNGEQKFYVHFQRPADVNKMSFLVWKRLNDDDDRWLYLPALDLVKRIRKDGWSTLVFRRRQT